MYRHLWMPFIYHLLGYLWQLFLLSNLLNYFGIIVVRYGDLKILTLFTCSSFQFHVPVVFQFYGSPVVSEDNKMVKVFTHLSEKIFSNLSF